jgi:hypothetical protein
MSTVLDFGLPKKLRPTEEHNDMHQSDAYAAGTFVPNMSEKDMLKWKGKKIGGSDPRVEIRKTVEGNDPALASRQASRGWQSEGHCAAQILAIVRPSGVVMSANGRMVFDNKTWHELFLAVAEAQVALAEK